MGKGKHRQGRSNQKRQPVEINNQNSGQAAPAKEDKEGRQKEGSFRGHGTNFAPEESESREGAPFETQEADGSGINNSDSDSVNQILLQLVSACSDGSLKDIDELCSKIIDLIDRKPDIKPEIFAEHRETIYQAIILLFGEEEGSNYKYTGGTLLDQIVRTGNDLGDFLEYLSGKNGTLPLFLQLLIISKEKGFLDASRLGMICSQIKCSEKSNLVIDQVQEEEVKTIQPILPYLYELAYNKPDLFESLEYLRQYYGLQKVFLGGVYRELLRRFLGELAAEPDGEQKLDFKYLDLLLEVMESSGFSLDLDEFGRVFERKLDSLVAPEDRGLLRRMMELVPEKEELLKKLYIQADRSYDLFIFLEECRKTANFKQDRFLEQYRELFQKVFQRASGRGAGIAASVDYLLALLPFLKENPLFPEEAVAFIGACEKKGLPEEEIFRPDEHGIVCKILHTSPCAPEILGLLYEAVDSRERFRLIDQIRGALGFLKSDFQSSYLHLFEKLFAGKESPDTMFLAELLLLLKDENLQEKHRQFLIDCLNSEQFNNPELIRKICAGPVDALLDREIQHFTKTAAGICLRLWKEQQRIGRAARALQKLLAYDQSLEGICWCVEQARDLPAGELIGFFETVLLLADKYSRDSEWARLKEGLGRLDFAGYWEKYQPHYLIRLAEEREDSTVAMLLFDGFSEAARLRLFRTASVLAERLGKTQVVREWIGKEIFKMDFHQALVLFLKEDPELFADVLHRGLDLLQQGKAENSAELAELAGKLINLVIYSGDFSAACQLLEVLSGVISFLQKITPENLRREFEQCQSENRKLQKILGSFAEAALELEAISVKHNCQTTLYLDNLVQDFAESKLSLLGEYGKQYPPDIFRERPGDFEHPGEKSETGFYELDRRGFKMDGPEGWPVLKIPAKLKKGGKDAAR